MNVHKNARLTPYRRAELVQRLQAGERGRGVATALGVSLRTVRKWWAQYRRRRPSRPRGPIEPAAHEPSRDCGGDRAGHQCPAAAAVDLYPDRGAGGRQRGDGVAHWGSAELRTGLACATETKASRLTSQERGRAVWCAEAPAVPSISGQRLYGALARRFRSR
jgi:predicted DNA-binding transcriptional regulator YafY